MKPVRPSVRHAPPSGGGIVARLLDAVARFRSDDASAPADAAYLCRVCGTTFRSHRHVCPECDGCAVETVTAVAGDPVVENPRD